MPSRIGPRGRSPTGRVVRVNPSQPTAQPPGVTLRLGELLWETENGDAEGTRACVEVAAPHLPERGILLT